MEIPASPELLNQQVPARNVYPDKQTAADIFVQRVNDGAIDFIETPTSSESQVGVYTESFRKNEAFEQRRVDNTFDLAFVRAKAWWLPAGKVDHSTWLDTASLRHVAVLKIDEDNIVINDFSGKFDLEKFYETLVEQTRFLATKGFNAAKQFHTVNVLSRDHPTFAVPPHLKKKYPEGYIHAQANKTGLLIINERALNETSESTTDYENTVGKGFTSTFLHEYGHFLHDGLNDFHDEYSVALGWRRRHEHMTDDYGNFLNKKRTSYFHVSELIDDYGKGVKVMGQAIPHVLITPDGPHDPEIKPPSIYGAEASHEDIAESFAAYALGEHLDKKRTVMMQKIIEPKLVFPAGYMPDISVTPMAPPDFDAFDYYMPKTIKFWHSHR